MNLLSKTKDWFNSDSSDLRRLTVKANNVSGAKDALQAAAQLSALQSKQLLQLQQKAEQEAAASSQMQRYAGQWKKDVQKSRSSQQPPTKSM